MATVPTLTVGGVDQTDYIHNKTLSVKLKSLDFTLVDPATSPALHDIVSLDDPEWHGRVSTIESYPLRTAGGDDHRWVKITCTNKHEATTASAPFGLSDSPNMSTTFPYKDFGYIQTLADQTDLATAEHRLDALVYEPGLVPGMTVAVTNAAEGLSAVSFIISEIQVDWLRDDTPTYQLQASIEGVDPVTLGDIISSGNCDCPPFVPCTTDYRVKSFQNADDLSVVFPDHTNGQHYTSMDGHPTTDYMTLYEGATYKIEYYCYHAPGPDPVGSNGLFATLGVVSGGTVGTFGPPYVVGYGTSGPAIYMGDIRGPDGCTFNPPNDIPYATVNWTVDVSGPAYGDPVDLYATLIEGSCASGDSYGSSLSMHATWLSGPDPRFETLEPCSDTPGPGQPMPTGHFVGDGSTDAFTTDYPYMAGSLQVVVEGVDWTDQVVEDDATAGDFSLAYPPPLATDGEPNVEAYYRYPKP